MLFFTFFYLIYFGYYFYISPKRPNGSVEFYYVDGHTIIYLPILAYGQYAHKSAKDCQSLVRRVSLKYFLVWGLEYRVLVWGVEWGRG